MRQHLDVHGDHGGPGLYERLEVTVRFLDHEVNIQGHLHNLPDGLHHRHANRQIRDEMAVHHVHVDEIGTAALHRSNLCSEDAEIRRQNRWRDAHGHRLTSSEIGSPGAIWNPAWGFWRRTMPAGTPGYG